MARERVTFQSQLLYVGSGQSGIHGDADLIPTQIQKVQLVNLTSDGNRTPIDEFGRLAALGYSSIDAPVGTLRFKYFLGNGENENALGFNTDGTKNFLNIDAPFEPNFYLLTVAETKDAVQSSNYTVAERQKHFVSSLGNGVLVNYSVEGEVGAVPSAILDWEGANVAFMTGSSGIPNPAIDKKTFCLRPGEVTITAGSTGSINTPTLRPEDITLDFGPSLLAEGGGVLPGNTVPSSLQPLHIRNFNIDVPLDVEEKESLGGGPRKEFETPIDIVFQCTALLTDVHSGNLINEICSATARDITVNLKPPCVGCSGENTNEPNMKFVLKGAVFDNQAILSTLQEEALVTLSFTTQLGAASVIDRGLIISGVYNT